MDKNSIPFWEEDNCAFPNEDELTKYLDKLDID